MTVDQENAVQATPAEDAPAPRQTAPAADDSAGSAAVDGDLPARLVGQFERWLDETLADEPPPRGLPQDLLRIDAAGESDSAGESDLYSLFSALTALTGETRLQGRAFKQLSELIAPLSASAPALEKLPAAQQELAETIAEALDRLAGDGDKLAIPGEQVCQTMIDLYDRLDRGLRTCRQGIEAIEAAQPRGLLWRLAGGPAFARRAGESAQGLRDACALLLARLQSAMHEWGIERVGNPGEPFDPRRMTVVDVRAGENAEPGSVVEVLRSGYAYSGTVRAVARVAVAKESETRSATQ